jgi:hypothetical protein
MIQKISAVTFRVASMKVSVRFYRLFYGGERSEFSSLRGTESESAILNWSRAPLESIGAA